MVHNWGAQQVTALDRVRKWLSTKSSPVFVLAGYAGTGKTTLAKHLVEGIDGTVYFGAFTGKAASVLGKTGCPNPSTLHKLMYVPKDRCRAKLNDLIGRRAELLARGESIEEIDKQIDTEQANLKRPAFKLNTESPLFKAALVVVDECYMVDKWMGADLLSFGCPVLALGDPAQLPPIHGKSYFTGPPDYMLTEIHRQAEDNPIIWLSREIREGRALRPGIYGDSRVLEYSTLDRDRLAEDILSTDQLLVGQNSTRRNSNARIRQLKNWNGALPREGEKVICLRNNHDEGLLNGQLWNLSMDASLQGEFAMLPLIGEDGQQITVDAHPQIFEGKEPDLWRKRQANEFDYGYALTVHKAQGSQWGTGILFDEWYHRHRQEWLYSGATRFRQRVDIVQMRR